MWFVYVLSSKKDRQLYIGSTEDLDRSMAEHASGFFDETADRQPLTCELYIGLPGKKQAKAVEAYFKTPAGNTMLRKRLMQQK